MLQNNLLMHIRRKHPEIDVPPVVTRNTMLHHSFIYTMVHSNNQNDVKKNLEKNIEKKRKGLLYVKFKNDWVHG